jgi:hypothetical protein
MSEEKHVSLVHCQRGVSRSAAVIVAFILWQYSRTLQEPCSDETFPTVESTIQAVKEKRKEVDPDIFFDILKMFRQDLIRASNRIQRRQKRCVACLYQVAVPELHPNNDPEMTFCDACFVKIDDLEGFVAVKKMLALHLQK